MTSLFGSWTLDNGGKPYYLEFLKPEGNGWLMYPLTTKALIRKETNFNAPIEYYYTSAFLGIDIHRPYNGINSSVLEIGPNKYVFIGDKLYEFDTPEPIIDYSSPIGNNDVPYPFALSENYIYLMVEKIFFKKELMHDTLHLSLLKTYAILDNELDSYIKSHFSPYSFYYGLDNQSVGKKMKTKEL